MSSRQHHVPPPPFLRVGVTPDSAPYVFRQDDRYQGVEIDFARRLASALGRRLAIVPTDWDEQIPSLRAGRTDVIMSGMSITPARSAQVAFADSYLTTSLGAVVRREDARRWPTAEDLLRTSPRIGVRAGTTGEALVRERRPDENIVPHRRSRDAIWELVNYRIDVYVTDLPIVQSAVKSHPGKLVAYPRVVGQQSLAWAFRPSDGALRREVNEILEQWRADGTLTTVLGAWPSLQ
jgi:polar amino acid transport system substrate-binding protein